MSTKELVERIDALYAKATHPPYAEGDFVYDALRGAVHYQDFDLICALVNAWPEIRELLAQGDGAQGVVTQAMVKAASDVLDPLIMGSFSYHRGILKRALEAALSAAPSVERDDSKGENT